MDISHFSGEWLSEYIYGDGSSGTHTLKFKDEDGVLVGSSLPQDDGSEVGLALRYDPEYRVLTGTWHEKTSPSGAYGGRTFHGAVQLLASGADDRLSGAWVGFNSDGSRINTGEWTLTKK